MNQGSGNGGERVSSIFSSLGNRLGNAVYGDQRQPGQTRARISGYISSIRDNYQQNVAGTFQGINDFGSGLSEAYPNVKIYRGKDQEMILFPCYSRPHLHKPHSSNETQEPINTEAVTPMVGNDGQAPIQQHWDHHEDENAIVDVDVRGWIYLPHKGAMNRKQRLALGIARQLAGLPTASYNSPKGSRDSSPHPIRDKIQEHSDRKEQELIDLETENILAKGKAEAKKADRGEYSENYGPSRNNRIDSLKRMTSESSVVSTDSLTMAQRRAAWVPPTEMGQEEAVLAHTNLMNRLRPFYANAVPNSPVSAFFYNEKESRMRTIYTNEYGHFAMRAALDFIPTNVRILAGENLSATDDVAIKEGAGVCVISDIDDTIKHTGMLSGAREAFRNAFLRNTEDLIIDGVSNWYNTMADKGVSFHYVSNSPWQLYPALASFFATVTLPAGSIHLKQYTGLYQGIFEPVAERKKGTLDRISRDFPERYFILIGDSGEADLEVYLDFVRDNPGRVLGVFIRDVTTPDKPGYFDPNSGPKFDDIPTHPSNPGSPRFGAIDESRDPELKAAIEESLKAFEAEEKRRGSTTSANASKPRYNGNSEDLISFSDDEGEIKPKPPPRPPRKPDSLRGQSMQLPPPALPARPKPKPSLDHRAQTDSIVPSHSAGSQTRRSTLQDQQQQQHGTLSSYLPSLSTLTGSPPASPPLSPTLSSGLTRGQVNRLELWRRRWIHASEVLRREGVVLRGWRTGDESTVAEALRLVAKAKKLQEMGSQEL